MTVQMENEIYEVNGRKCITLEQHEKELREVQARLDDRAFIATNEYYLSIINRLETASNTWQKKYEELREQTGKTMTVQMADKIYEMTAKQYKGFLKVVKCYLPVGIYAVEKDGVAIMMNEKPKDKEDLRKQVGDFKKKGFKVYWNDFETV